MDNQNSSQDQTIDMGAIIALIILIIIGVIFYLVIYKKDDANNEIVNVSKQQELKESSPGMMLEKQKPSSVPNDMNVAGGKTKDEIAALSYMQNKKYMDSVAALEAKVQSAKESQNQSQLIKLYVELIALHEKYHHYDKAVVLLKELADYGLRNRQYVNAAESYNKIAYLYMMSKDGKSASEYYRKALETVKKTNNVNYIAYMHHNMGQSYLMHRDYRSASDAFLEALYIHRENNNDVNAVETLNALSMTHHLAGRLQDALLFQIESLNLNIKNKRPDKIIDDYVALGAIYNDMGDKANACKALSEGYQMIHDTKLDYTGNRFEVRKQYEKVLELAACDGTTNSFGME